MRTLTAESAWSGRKPGRRREWDRRFVSSIHSRGILRMLLVSGLSIDRHRAAEAFNVGGFTCSGRAPHFYREQPGRRGSPPPYPERRRFIRRQPPLSMASTSLQECARAAQSAGAEALDGDDAEFDDADRLPQLVLGGGVRLEGDDAIDELGQRRTMMVLAIVAASLAAVALDYERGMAGFHWLQELAHNSAPQLPSHAPDNGVGGVHFTPLKSLATGVGAGFTRAVSRTITFPLDTLKTRNQVSRMRAVDRAALPEEMRRLIDKPATFSGVFKGFSAFLAQAGPSNAMFFLFYDALNAMGAAVLAGASLSGGPWPAALHLGASSLSTVPANVVKTPAEVVKQRLQVGQETGTSVQAFLSILRNDGVSGLFVGGREQLIREIPFNAIQFTVYEFLKTAAGGSHLWADAALGAASSAAAAVATQPVDTVKTRVMTKSVPGISENGESGFIQAAKNVAEAEGAGALFLGLLPRVALVSTGGAFYFWGQELTSQVLTAAGF